MNDSHFPPLERYLTRFLKSAANNTVFKDVVGRAFKLEFGYRRGFHIHAIFYVDGNVRRSEQEVTDLAQGLGDVWVKASSWTGSFHNSNGDRELFRQIGTDALGLILQGDHKKRQLFHEHVIDYASKAEQSITWSNRHPQVKANGEEVPGRVRTLRLSQIDAGATGDTNKGKFF